MKNEQSNSLNNIPDYGSIRYCEDNRILKSYYKHVINCKDVEELHSVVSDYAEHDIDYMFNSNNMVDISEYYNMPVFRMSAYDELNNITNALVNFWNDCFSVEMNFQHFTHLIRYSIYTVDDIQAIYIDLNGAGLQL